MQLIASLFLPLLMLFHLVGPVPGDLGVRNAGSALAPAPPTAPAARGSNRTPRPASRHWLMLQQTAPQHRGGTEDGYLHAEVSSALFGFVDDLELLILHDSQEVQARSISRLGDSDLGVNARRLMELDAALKA